MVYPLPTQIMLIIALCTVQFGGFSFCFLKFVIPGLAGL
jgi:hypothetical protein